MRSDPLAYEEREKFLLSIRQALDEARRSGDKRCLEQVKGSVQPGLYEHWKCTEKEPKLYAVLRVVLEVDTLYPSVDYSALYPPHLAEPASRPLIEFDRGFLKPIKRAEYTGPRFVLVEPLSFIEAAKLINRAGELVNCKTRTQIINRALELARE